MFVKRVKIIGLKQDSGLLGDCAFWAQASHACQVRGFWALLATGESKTSLMTDQNAAHTESASNRRREKS